MSIEFKAGLPFAEREASLRPGFRFDYREGRIKVTVEVIDVDWGDFVTLKLRVVDATQSQASSPQQGDTFTASYRAGEAPFYVWQFYAKEQAT